MNAGVFIVAVMCAQHAFAERVYVTQGEFGETSFSDVALPGAQAVDLELGDPSSEEVLQAQQQMQVTAELVAELADARHARTQARAQQRAAAKAQEPPAALPPAEIEDRYLYPYARWPFSRRPGIGPPRDPGRPQRPPKAAPEDVPPGFASKWIVGSADR